MNPLTARPAARPVVAPPLALRIAVVVLALVLGTLYFLQSATLAPNHTDGGLLLGYIDDMSSGQWPFYDFVDAYGPFNWVLPVLFYKVAGEAAWGVRLWLVVLKLLSVALTYAFVRRLSAVPSVGDRPASEGDFYASLAAVIMTVLLGAQWQSLQTAYAFLNVIPLVVGVWFAVLGAPPEHSNRRLWMAASLTAVAIWTKLNTGMFLFAGGLFVYFFWNATSPGPERTGGARRRPLFWVRSAGLVAYGVLFCAFVRAHLNVWFVLYLLIPLGMALVWTFWHAWRQGEEALAAAPFRGFWRYAAATSGLSLLFLFGYYRQHVGEYVGQLVGILSSINYTAPLPVLGEAGSYVGLNEFYWLQLPWLFTLLCLLWMILAPFLGPSAFGDEWRFRRAQVSGLFVFVTLHGFVVYARADETHVYQAVVLAAPMIFVLVAQLDAFLRAALPRAVVPTRIGIAAGTLAFCSTLVVLPTPNSFDFSISEWQHLKLRHLRYREINSPYVRDFSAHLSDHDWDAMEDQAAAYVRSVTVPGEEMLLLTANRLMYLNSDTRPVGGRYHFYFYLVSVGLLDRKGFDRLVPPHVVDDILANPPRVMVAAFGYVPLALRFPKLAFIRDNWYERTKTIGHIYIYQLKPPQQRPPIPEP